MSQDPSHSVTVTVPVTVPVAASPAGARSLEFWFDFSSPYAYLAATQVGALAARAGAAVRWRPLLLGALFREIGQADVPLFAMNPARQAHQGIELSRAAWWWGVPFRFNPHFPLRTVLPLRCALAHPDPGALIGRIFRAAWAEEQDISQPEVLLACGATLELLEAAAGQKDALFAANAEAKARGVFGVPTFFVHEAAGGADGAGRSWMFWGQDRLGAVEDCLRGMNPPGEIRG